MKIEKTKPKKSISEVVRFTLWTVCYSDRHFSSDFGSKFSFVHVRFSAFGDEGADISAAGVFR